MAEQNIAIDIVDAAEINVTELNAAEINVETPDDATGKTITNELILPNSTNGQLYANYGTTNNVDYVNSMKRYVRTQTIEAPVVARDWFGYSYTLAYKYMAVGVYNYYTDVSTINIYKYEYSWQLVQVITLNPNEYNYSIYMSLDGKYLAARIENNDDFNDYIYIYYRASEEFNLIQDNITDINLLSNYIVSFSLDGKYLAISKFINNGIINIEIYQINENNLYELYYTIPLELKIHPSRIELSNDGQYLIVGVGNNAIDYPFYNGSVYIYKDNILITTLHEDNVENEKNNFGRYVKLSPCNNYLAVFSHRDNGIIYVYRLELGTYILYDTIQINYNDEEYIEMAPSFTISMDGKYVIVRAYTYDEPYNLLIYIFYRSDKYKQIGKIIAEHGRIRGDAFIDISIDGNMLMIGNPYTTIMDENGIVEIDEDGEEIEGGEIYVYELCDDVISDNIAIDATTGMTYAVGNYITTLIKTAATTSYTVTLPTILMDGYKLKITNTVGSSGNLTFDKSVTNYTATEFITGMTITVIYSVELNKWVKI